MDREGHKREKLFAKLSGKRGKHLSVFTDARDMSDSSLQAYSSPNVSNVVDFEPGRTLHEDEWYKISLDAPLIAEMIQPYTSNANTTSDVTTIKAADYQKVVALYKTDGHRLLVTKISAGMRVESKTFIGINDHPEIVSYRKAIEFTGYVDAYYDGNGVLYFKNYSKISSLFPGIELFYRDATIEEKEAFLAEPFLNIQGINTNDIGMRDARKIALIRDDDRIKLDDPEFQKNVIAYAEKYAPGLATDNKLLIIDKNTLHKSLSILTARYYTSELFGDKLEAIDSVRLEA